MKRALSLRSVRAAMVVAAIASGLMCLAPLVGAPGIESALVLGLLLPPFAGAIGVRVLDAARRAGGAPVGEVLGQASASVTLVWLVPVALLLLNTLRVPICAPLEGLGFLVLGPLFAVLLSSASGVLLGALVPRVRLATTLAVLLPIASYVAELWMFYATPAVYAYGHFVGYFPGTLYDPDITITLSYVSYRVLTLVWWLCVAATLGALFDRSLKARVAVTRRRWPLAAAALVFFALALAGEGEGHALGHWSTTETIAERLGGHLEGERCDVIYPRETPRENAQRLVRDCDFRVRLSERVLGVRQAHRVTAFFFRSADEKRVLMGASNTYVAKPWRNEVYLQVSEWPHPVLFHEIVHVVAGNIGRGPFRIAGRASGVLPSPAVIEGVAVAIAWDEREGLTPHQWARAMLELELMPSLSSVQGLEFLLQPSSRAYTASGSFVRWMMHTRGSASVRRLYQDGWDEALGEPIADAEADWHRFLREEVELPEEARALAQARFERPGIWGQICPHRIANLRAELAGDLAAGDEEAAAGTCREILDLDAGQAAIRAALVGVLARSGDISAAEAELAQVVGPPSAARPIVWRAQQGLADALWWGEDRDRAATIYDALLEEPMGADTRRQIETRRFALREDSVTEAALRQLLVPPIGMTSDAATSMHHITSMRGMRPDGLADYLAARQMMFRQRYDLALPLVRTARRLGLPSESAEREARRMEGLIAFGAGEVDASQQIWWQVLRDDPSAGEAVEARDWLARARLTAATD